MRGWGPEPAAPRPPWAAGGETFHDLCDGWGDGWGDCVTACPPGIVLRGPGGRPEVDFGRGACSLYGACAPVCPADAITFHEIAAQEVASCPAA